MTDSKFPRTCGECNACCFMRPATVPPPRLAVVQAATPTTVKAASASIEKPARSECPHQCERGCGIFAETDRPQECVSFNCAWLSRAPGFERGALRPDRLGVYGYGERMPASGEPGLYLVEVIPGALEKREVQNLMRLWMQQHVPVCTVTIDGEATVNL